MSTELQTKGQEAGLSVIPADNSMMAKTVIGQNGQALVDILKDSITKVQNDPDYIPQATAIRENIREIIDLAKVEAQTIVALNNFNSGK
ncbi:MAG TPA: hypothetical protein VGM41_08340 [Chitinophagaceae bacterium]|jgi:hypothetical protein